MTIKKVQLQGSQEQFNQHLIQRLNEFSIVQASFTTANANATFTHGLNRKPQYFTLMKANKPVKIFATSSGAWTASQIVLQADNSNVSTTIRVE